MDHTDCLRRSHRARVEARAEMFMGRRRTRAAPVDVVVELVWSREFVEVEVGYKYNTKVKESTPRYRGHNRPRRWRVQVIFRAFGHKRRRCG